MTKTDLGREIMRVCYLQGDFLLRSGKRSAEYFDKYQLEARPELLAAASGLMVDKIPAGTEVLAGLEMGGIPVATAMSLHSRYPMVMVRKKAKPYGTMRLAEGVEVKGKRVLVIEDVITTGGQVVESVGELRAAGALIDSVLCVIDRSEGNHEALSKAGLTLTPLFTIEELRGLAG